jgi:hypothetical protein
MVRKRLPVANRNTGEQLYDDAGNPRTWNVKTARIDESRVPSYIVPPGIAQCRVRDQSIDMRRKIFTLTSLSRAASTLGLSGTTGRWWS